MQQHPELLFLVEPDPDGGYVARAVGHAIFTQGDSEDELREMIREAVRCHFDEDDPERPERIRILWIAAEEELAA